MSSEDVLAREEASRHLDAHTPMALEAPRKQRGPKLTDEERAARAEARRLEREEARALRAAQRAALKADAQAAKLDGAEGGRIALPAVVLRDGTVQSVSPAGAVEVIRLYLDALCLDCWTGETRVITRDGIRPIEELAGTEPELLVPNFSPNSRSVLSGTGTFRRAPVRYLGTQETYEVTLVRNRTTKKLRVTAGHKWFTTTRVEWPNGDKTRARQRQFKKATLDLRPGDRLQPLKSHKGTVERTAMPVAVAQGFVFGDGTAPDSRSITYSPPASVDIYANGKDHVMVPLFRALQATESTFDYKGGGTYTKFSNLPRSWKAVPDIRESRNFLLSWLSGYFAADGSVGKGGAPTLTTVTRAHAEFVCSVAAVCGVDYQLREYESSTGFRTTGLPYYQVGLRARDLPSWFFVAEEHKRTIDAALTARELRQYWKVVSVEPTGCIERVYCAEVADVHAFAMDGSFMSGNCETSGYWIGHSFYELRTLQLGGEEMAVVLDASDSLQLQIASHALRNAVKLHAHSATADLVPCVHAGLIGWDEAWGKMHDSVLYAKLSDPRMSGSDANGLKDLARDLLREYAVSDAAEKGKNDLFRTMKCLINTEPTTPPEKNGWYQVNKYAVTMIRYAGADVLDLAAVLRVLPPLPVSGEVLDRERRLQAVCARVAYEGAPLDSVHVKAKISDHETGREETRNNVRILSDGKITNPSSPDVGASLTALFPELDGVLETSEKTGRPSAAKSSLEKIKNDDLSGILAKQVLDYRHHVTTLGLLLRPLENLCDQGDSRMRPIVYTINADTGRMSTVRVNSQQFSRQGGIRACVTAPPGYRGISADFQGCEIRVAAALSGDKDLLEAESSAQCYLCKGNPCECGKERKGLHWMAAIEAFGPEAVKEDRYNSKRIIFSKLFGGSAQAGARQTGIALADSQRIHDAFEALAPVYAEWDRWLRQCYYDGSFVWRDFRTGQNYSQPLEGRRRATYRAYSGRNIYVNAPHAFGNFAIQGTARELLADGILAWDQGPYREAVLIPVHDEVIGFVKEEAAAEATKYLVECMTTSVLSTPDWDVTIGADPDTPWLAWPDSS